MQHGHIIPPAKRAAAIPGQVPARIIICLCSQFFVFKPETSHLAPGIRHCAV